MVNKDAAGHVYVDVDNVRITYVPAADRKPGADWSGADVLRVQSYRGTEDRSLHMGAELPVPSSDVFVRLLAGLCTVYVPTERTQVARGERVEKPELVKWLKQALVNLNGRARIVDLCKEVWAQHEGDLRASGDLLFTWQYDIRWAAYELRSQGVMRPENESPKGIWELT